MRRLILFAALLWPSLLFSQNARWDGITLSPSGLPVSVNVSVCNSPGLLTTAAQVTGNTAILTFGSSPITAGFVANQSIVVSGFTGADTYFNSGTLAPFTSTVTITAVSATTIIFPLSHANASASTNGSVFQLGTGSTPCAPLASIFSDAAGTVSIAQPGLTSSGTGNVGFYVAAGNYQVEYSGSTIGSTLQPLTLSCPLTGNCAFTGFVDQQYNGAVRIICNHLGTSAGWAGADVSAWIANAHATLPSNGGTLDATSCVGSQAITQEIAIGNVNGNQSVKLLLPTTGPNNNTWVSTQTGGTAYVLRVYSRSIVLGAGTGEGQSFTITAGATANVDTVCGNDPTGVYVRMEGFSCQAAAGATVAKAVLHITGFADETYVAHITAFTQSANAHKACWVHNGGIAAFEFLNCETSGAPSGSGAVPCTFGNGSTDSLTAIHVNQISCVHPSIGMNAMVVQQWNGGAQGNVFESVYMEECTIAGGCVFNQDTVTPYISVQAFATPQAADLFINPIASADIAGSTRYAMDIASTGRVTVVNLRGSNTSSNMINDHNPGAVPVQKSPTSTVSYTTEDFYAPNIQMYNANAVWKISPFGASGDLTMTQVSPGNFAWQFGSGGSTSKFTNSATGARNWFFPDASGTVGIRIGSATPGNGVKFDANGNLVDSGAPTIGFTSVNVTPVTVSTNTTGDQNLMALTITAGALNSVSRTLLIQLAGVYSTPAGSTAVLTHKLKLCTVSGCGSGTVITLATWATTALGAIQVTNDPYNATLNATTQTAGASAAFEAHGNLTIDLSVLTTAAESVFADNNTATVGTIDSTATLFLQHTVAFSAGSASNTDTDRQMIADTVD